MPLLEIADHKQKVTARIALEQSTAELVDRYAVYAKGSADEVIEKALLFVFSKDKAFQEYIAKPSEEKPSEPLRLSIPTNNPNRQKPGRKPAHSSAAV